MTDEWSDDAYQVLRAGDYTIFPYVPDAGHRRLIELAHADPAVTAIPLTTEEEGVALCAGADLGGARAALLVQSSGVGNLVNALSLIAHCRFPLLALVTMRGDFGEQNPWQYAMGRATEPVLAAMGVDTVRVDRPDDVEPTLTAATGAVARAGRAVAVLLTQRLIPPKEF